LWNWQNSTNSVKKQYEAALAVISCLSAFGWILIPTKQLTKPAEAMQHTCEVVKFARSIMLMAMVVFNFLRRIELF